MEASIKDSGNKIKRMDKGHFITQMGTFMREIGLKIKPTGMESTLIQMEQSIQANGKMTSSMDMECKNGWTGKNTRANTVTELRQAKEY